MGVALVATLGNDTERNRATPFVDWLRASTQLLGPGPLERIVSVLDQPLDPAMPTPRVTNWIKGRLAPFRLPQPADQGGAPAGGNEHGNPMPELPPLPQAIGQNAYSLLELAKIQAACLLEDHEFDLERPAIYDRMLTEGRKPMSRVRVLLEDILRPQDDLTSLSTVLVQVTDDIAKDKKELNFGFGEDVTYQSCHRGLSPFAVVNVSMATMSLRQRKAERYAKVTFQTSADVEANDLFPDPIPTTFLEAAELLKRYI